jgi:hypothetical protein
MRVGGQRHAPATLSPGKRLGTHFIGGWVGPRASMNVCGKGRPTGIGSPVRPAHTNYALPAPHIRAYLQSKYRDGNSVYRSSDCKQEMVISLPLCSVQTHSLYNLSSCITKRHTLFGSFELAYYNLHERDKFFKSR